MPLDLSHAADELRDSIPPVAATLAELRFRADELKAELFEYNDLLESSRHAQQQILISESTTRAMLTSSLIEALASRAVAESIRRQVTAKLYFHVSSNDIRPRRHNRLSRLFDLILLRLGRAGQAMIIARSGLSWTNGALSRRLRGLLTYASGGSDPSVVAHPLFDQASYVAADPGLAGSSISPLAHYLVAGGREGRSTHPLFDGKYYYENNSREISATGLTPLEHFVRMGAPKGRNPHPLFDISYYASHALIQDQSENPLVHYLQTGWRLGLSPHPLFDPGWYTRQMPDGASMVPPLVHYLTTGRFRGLSPHPLFDPVTYLAEYPDVATTGMEPLTHFVLRGGREGRNPSAWFDVSHYLKGRTSPLQFHDNPLVDYLQGGCWTGSEAGEGFATAAYVASVRGLVPLGMTPLEHWVRNSTG